jgi:hypothetical protein
VYISPASACGAHAKNMTKIGFLYVSCAATKIC